MDTVISNPITGDNTITCERLVGEIADALSRLPYVRAIALFGSLADGRADRWSDIDILLACDDVGQTSWDAAEAIRGIKPVIYYRKFTLADQPSGRYWFEGVSLFHRLDINFHSVDEYAQYRAEPTRYGKDIVLREIHSSFAEEAILPWTCAPANPLEISERETDIGLWCYRALCRMKDYHRGVISEAELRDAADGLIKCAGDLPPDAAMAGGEIGRFVHDVLDTYRAIVKPGP